MTQGTEARWCQTSAAHNKITADAKTKHSVSVALLGTTAANRPPNKPTTTTSIRSCTSTDGALNQQKLRRLSQCRNNSPSFDLNHVCSRKRLLRFVCPSRRWLRAEANIYPPRCVSKVTLHFRWPFPRDPSSPSRPITIKVSFFFFKHLLHLSRRRPHATIIASLISYVFTRRDRGQLILSLNFATDTSTASVLMCPPRRPIFQEN